MGAAASPREAGLWLFLTTLLLTSASVGAAAPPEVRKKGHWTVQIQLPNNCTADTQTTAYELQSCIKPCVVKGPLDFYLNQGETIQVSFRANSSSMVIVGGSQNLQFQDDPIPDMTVQTATAPANFISPVTFAGFTFAPRQKFYQVFQDGTLAKLSIYAFDSAGRKASKGLATYASAACRTSLDLHMLSAPSNVTASGSQLYQQPAGGNGSAALSRANSLILVFGLFAGVLVLCCLIGCCMRAPRQTHRPSVQLGSL